MANRPAGTGGARVLSSTNTVAKVVPDHLTTAPGARPVTLTVRVNAGPPASMGLGVAEVTTGVELWAYATAVRQMRAKKSRISSIVIGSRRAARLKRDGSPDANPGPPLGFRGAWCDGARWPTPRRVGASP